MEPFKVGQHFEYWGVVEEVYPLGDSFQYRFGRDCFVHHVCLENLRRYN